MKTVSVSEIIRTAQLGNTLYVLATEAEAEIAATRERQRALTKAIENIAIQKLEDEMDEEDREDADYQEGYESIVKIARAALAAKEG